MANVLYLTQDGITDHIGQAQIAPYILGLARLGHRIHVLSPEKGTRPDLIEKYRAVFDAAGVRWTTVPYANKPPLISSFWMLRQMYRAAEEIVRRERPEIVHSRSYLPWEIVVRLKAKFGLKAIMDFRDFWADLRLETAPFKFVYRWFKRREHSYFEAADHVVTLTSRAVDILMSWYPKAVEGRRDRYTVIPCCADFEHFDPAKVKRNEVEALRRSLGLGDGPVMLYLGSIGPDYLLPQMLELFKQLRVARPAAHFLLLSTNAANQVEEARVAVGLPEDAIKVTAVERAAVPAHIALADFSVVFVRPSLSKAGGSPTKLAEVFAMNVPVIANSRVGDLEAIIDYGRNGSVVVHDFEPDTLRAAAEKVLSLPDERRARIRANSCEFTLEEGVRRYHRIYEQLAAEPVASMAA